MRPRARARVAAAVPCFELARLGRRPGQAALHAHVPPHLVRFRNLPPTPVSTLERNRQIAMEAGLEYVYIGNVPGHEGERTYCPRCKKLLIFRQGYSIGEVHIAKGKCKFCGKPIAGIWA